MRIEQDVSDVIFQCFHGGGTSRQAVPTACNVDPSPNPHSCWNCQYSKNLDNKGGADLQCCLLLARSRFRWLSGLCAAQRSGVCGLPAASSEPQPALQSVQVWLVCAAGQTGPPGSTAAAAYCPCAKSEHCAVPAGVRGKGASGVKLTTASKKYVMQRKYGACSKYRDLLTQAAGLALSATS